jgi:hypothetical protein
MRQPAAKDFREKNLPDPRNRLEEITNRALYSAGSYAASTGFELTRQTILPKIGPTLYAFVNKARDPSSKEPSGGTSAAPLQSNEKERLAALRRYQVLDTLPEPAFDDLAALAAQICQTPIAFINFIDGNRQWFKASFGSESWEIPLESGVCPYAIAGEACLGDRLSPHRQRRSGFLTNKK